MESRYGRSQRGDPARRRCRSLEGGDGEDEHEEGEVITQIRECRRGQHRSRGVREQDGDVGGKGKKRTPEHGCAKRELCRNSKCKGRESRLVSNKHGLGEESEGPVGEHNVSPEVETVVDGEMKGDRP